MAAIDNALDTSANRGIMLALLAGVLFFVLRRRSGFSAARRKYKKARKAFSVYAGNSGVNTGVPFRGYSYSALKRGMF